MHITELISRLRKLDIHMWLEGEKLRYNAPEGAFTQEIKEEVLKQKAEIINFLKTSGNWDETARSKIQAASTQKDVPLSFSQQRLWLVGQMDVDNYAYNIPAAVRLEGSLNIASLGKGIQEIAHRHTVLCTTLRVSNGKVVQVVNPNMEIPLIRIDLSDRTEEDRKKRTEELMYEEAITPFDLEMGPLLRTKLLVWGDKQYVLLLTMHHIVSDDWSLNVFVRELATLYTAFCEGKPSPLSPLPIQYSDYAIWQRKWMETYDMEVQLTFWKKQLHNIEEVPEFPSDYPRPPVQTYRGLRDFVMLPKETVTALKTLSQKEGSTLFTVLLSAFKLLLHQYTGLTDIVVGAPVSGRTQREVEELIGFFVNTVVLRTQLEEGLTFRQWMKQVKDTVAGAFENQDIPFEKLVENLQTKRDRSRTPFFQVLFNMLNSSLEVELPGVRIRPYTEFIIGAPNLGAKLDLTLLAIEHSNGMQLDFSFNADLFSQETVQWLLQHFTKLLEAVVQTPDAIISELPQLTPREVLHSEPNWEFIPFAREEVNQSLASRFETQVQIAPHAIAVEDDEDNISYEALNQKADILARHIHQHYDDRYSLTKAETIRYSRQLYLDGWGVETQEKLKALTVFAAGAGGSGSPTIMQLALLGVGTIIICDFDNVELSNLNRQVLHDESRIGINKAVSAAMSVKKINPNVKVIVREEKITRENVFELVGDAAVIFDNVDDIETKFVLSTCAVARGIPHVISSMLERSAYAAVFHTPHTPCFHCLYDVNKLQHVRAMREADGGKNKVPNSVSSPALFLSTGFACNEALKIVLGLENPAYNKYFFFNQQASLKLTQTRGYRIVTYPFSDYFKELCREQGFDWEQGFSGRFVEELDVQKNPQCPLCSGQETHFDIPAAATSEVVCIKERVETEEDRPQLVALLLGHNIGMITGILGTLKAGKAFVIMDPSYPIERLEYILRDTNARFIVTDVEHVQLATALRDKVNGNIGILDIETLPQTTMDAVPVPKAGPDSLAYIMYTSGSTGNPKGVMQTQRNVLHYTMNYTNGLHISKEDRLSLIPSFSFSAAMMDTFAALLNGAVLCLYNIRKKGPNELGAWLNERRITVYHSVPTVFRHFVAGIPDGMRFPYIRMIDFGGEPVSRLDVELYQKHFEDTCRLVNGLGATELNVIRQFHINKEMSMTGNVVPVGYAVEDTEVILLDEDGRRVGYNRSGEIVICSRYLSPGYWEQEEQTREVLEEDPDYPLLRSYHTGDLGRLHTDGCLEHLGRKDSQLKIRGIRIEASEIETVLLEREEVKSAIVMAEENSLGDKQLVAYMVAEGQYDDLLKVLREHLMERLPEYMIPSSFIRLDAIPQTLTGKIDRRALKTAGGVRLETSLVYSAPTNEKEEILADIWKQILRREKIGIHEDFFNLGGDSLLGLRMIDMAHQLGLDFTPQQLFQNSTIARLANVAEDIKYSVNDSGYLKKYETVEGEIGLLPVQMRFFSRNFTNMHHWNCSYMIYSKYGLDEQIIHKVFEKLIEHHDALRIVFKKEAAGVKQYNRGMEGKFFDLEVFDFTRCTDYVDAIKAETRRIHGRLDLEQGPLVKLGLFKTAEGDHLLIVIHHLVFDGVSSNILMDDLAQSYFQVLRGEEIKLPGKTHSLMDWSERLYEYANSSKLLNEFAYWKEVEDTVTTPLPKDAIAEDDRIRDSRTIKRKLLGDEDTKKLTVLSRETSFDIEIILLAALGMTIKDWSCGDKTLIHMVGHGREKLFEDIDINRTIGWFSVYYPFVLDLLATEDLKYLLGHIAGCLNRVPGNGIGYEVLKFLTSQENKDDFIFDTEPEISFNYAGNLGGSQGGYNDYVSISPISSGVTMSYDTEREYTFVMDLHISEDILHLKMNYNRYEYKESTIEMLIGAFAGNIMKIISGIENSKSN